MTDKMLMRNVDFKKLPREIRKQELKFQTNYYRDTFDSFDEKINKKYSYKSDYKFICKLLYKIDSDFKWNLIKDEYGDLFCIRADRYYE